MNATARQLLSGTLRAIREIDPDAADQLDVAIAHLNDPQQRPKELGLVVNQATTARMLSLSRWSVRNLEISGRLRAVMIGGAKRFRVSDIRRLTGESVT